MKAGTDHFATSEQPENLVLQHLRHIRGALDRMGDDMLTVKDRLGGLERSVAQVQVTLAEHSGRMDRIERRLGRIETWLDLVEA